MKISRKDLKRIISEVALSDEQKDNIEKVASDALTKAGGAADDDIVKKAVKDETGVDVDDPEEIDGVDRLSSGDLVKSDEVESLVAESIVRSIIIEELQKIGFYKKYSYGLDDVPEKTKAHDDIIGHT